MNLSLRMKMMNQYRHGEKDLTNLSVNAAEDHNHSYQKEDRNENGSRTERIDQSTSIKVIITRLKEKWVSRYQNMAVMSNRINVV